MNKQKLIIVGGGTAGWLTALSLHKKFSNKFEITVIENTEIGILGAGEGSVPALVDFLLSIDIVPRDFLANTDGTFKLGIKFKNWNDDNTSYFHPFSLQHTYDSLGDNFHYKSLLMYEYLNSHSNSNDFILQSILSEQRRLPIVIDERNNLKFLGGYSIHFNAVKTAAYLKNIAISRGILHKDILVQDIVQDEHGFITHLKIKDHEDLPLDFVVDCTGFKRFIINKLNGVWKSYSDMLPVNRAMPFFINNDNLENVNPCTDAIAMKHGWIWKIPVKGRYGCGYVFNDSITDDQAKQEIEELFGFEITSPRMFKFDAGCYEKSWIKNCVTMGLATGFIEPLEATSIWSSILALRCFENVFDHNLGRNAEAVEIYNRQVYKNNISIRDFIYFHYCTNRTDTDFWNSFLNNSKMPANIEFILDPKNTKIAPSIGDELFSNHSYFYVGTGLNIGMYSKTAIDNYMESNYNKENRYKFGMEAIRFKEKIKLQVSKTIHHSELLRSLN